MINIFAQTSGAGEKMKKYDLFRGDIIIIIDGPYTSLMFR